MATETLIPDSGGAETALDYYDGSQHDPDVLHNFEQIDDQDGEGNPDPDDSSTTVLSPTNSWERDLYNLPAHSGSGTINKITVYFRIYGPLAGQRAKPVIRSDTTVTEGTERTPTLGVWETLSQEWAQNPVGPANWTWADIDDLQIGVSLLGDKAGAMYCTIVYVVIDYTPAVGTNTQINIADTWKDVDSMQINISDIWKNVVQVLQNIGNVWKTVFG